MLHMYILMKLAIGKVNNFLSLLSFVRSFFLSLTLDEKTDQTNTLPFHINDKWSHLSQLHLYVSMNIHQIFNPSTAFICALN
jgi:hypothetical protein